MSDLPQRHSQEIMDAEIDLRGLIQAIWRRKLIVIVATLIGAGLGLGAALIVPKKYEAKVVMALVSDEIGANSAGASELGDYGGLASLVGISVPNSGQKAIALATLESANLSARFIESRGLLPVLFWRKWDASRHAFKADEKAPTLWDATAMFDKKIRAIDQDKRSGMVILTMTWRDPQAVAAWANQYVADANSILKARAIADSEKNIEYLNAQAEKSNVVELRQSIFALLRIEIRKAMLAQGSSEYALRVVDPAVAPEKATFPVPSLWCLVGAVVGLFCSAFLIAVRSTI